MPLEDIVEETKRIIQTAEEQQIVLRLVGGLAIHMHCPSAMHRTLTRKYPDIDFISHKGLSKRLRIFFQELGYEPAAMFNAIQGDKRLLFLDPAAKRRVDIFLDVFEMCHKFDFHDRLELDKWTLTPSDLLVTKLQVVEINEKDYKDTIALILDHQIGDKDDLEMINGRYIASLCENEWGIHKTFTRNLKWLSDSLEKYLDDTEQVKLVRSKINNLLDRIERQPKTLRWRMRASVGEKVAWYELPGKV